MKLTPKAFCFVDDAVRKLLDSKSVATWVEWTRNAPTGDLPASVSDIATRALQEASRTIRTLLESGDLDDDKEADALNDLGFILAVEKGLRLENVGN